LKGIYFSSIFALVAKLTSLRFLLVVAAALDLEVEQMDVKTTLVRLHNLHDDLHVTFLALFKASNNDVNDTIFKIFFLFHSMSGDFRPVFPYRPRFKLNCLDLCICICLYQCPNPN
jgi:hypothetical protein